MLAENKYSNFTRKITRNYLKITRLLPRITQSYLKITQKLPENKPNTNQSFMQESYSIIS